MLTGSEVQPNKCCYVIIDLLFFLLEVNMDNFNFFGPQYQDIVKSNVSTTKPIEQKNTKEKSKVIRPRTYAIYRRHKDETKNDDHVRMSI